MKLIIALLAGSVALNVGLLICHHESASIASASSAVPSVPAEARSEKEGHTVPAGASASHGSRWSEVDSTDLTTLMANLRRAGFPPFAVAAIIGARVDLSYADQLRALMAQIDAVPYWKSDAAGSAQTSQYFTAYHQLERERTAQLRKLLGDDFTLTGLELSGAEQREFGNVSPAKAAALERLARDYKEMSAQLTAASFGITLPGDREKFELLAREKQADLTALLSPAELADYEMRNSAVTSRLRAAFTMMDASEDEFTAIFRIQQDYDSRLATVSAAEREALQVEMAQRIQSALGDERYADYVRATSSEYRQLNAIVQREQVPEAAANRAFGLRDAVASESNRIAADSAISTDEKLEALRTLAQQTRERILTELGAKAGNAYLNIADRWLNRIERGATVRFGPENLATYRPVVPARSGKPTS